MEPHQNARWAYLNPRYSLCVVSFNALGAIPPQIRPGARLEHPIPVQMVTPPHAKRPLLQSRVEAGGQVIRWFLEIMNALNICRCLALAWKGPVSTVREPRSLAVWYALGNSQIAILNFRYCSGFNCAPGFSVRGITRTSKERRVLLHRGEHTHLVP